MFGLPLHPAIVHLPLGIAFVLPILIGVSLILFKKQRLAANSWLVIVLLQLLLVTSAVVTLKTGEQEEEKLEAIVGEAVLEQHENKAKLFTIATAVGLVVFGATAFARRPHVRQNLYVTSWIVSIAIAVLAIFVGHSGGALVYQHDAASYYNSNNPPTQQTPERLD